MSSFQVLLDAPAEAKRRLQIATLGEGFKDGRYGEFDITPDDVASWQQNLDKLPGGRALIDLDHRADRTPRNSEAAGWITGVSLEDGVPMADVEWTPVGEDAISSKRYLFFSPTYGTFTDEHGAAHDNTLVGGALTNKPFLSAMPTLTLASEETLQAAADADHAEASRRLLDALTSKQRSNLPADAFAIPEDRAYPIHDLSHARNALARAAGKPEESRVKAAVHKRYPQLKAAAGGGSDSRRAMDAELLKALDLDEGADEAKVLEKVTELKAKVDEAAAKAAPEPAEPEPTKTLEQQALDAGKVLLDAGAVQALQSDATAGRQASEQLATERYENLFQRCLDSGKALPAEKDEFDEDFTNFDQERTLARLQKRLDSGPQLLNTKPSQWRNGEGPDAEDETPAGVHAASHQLHREVLKRLEADSRPPADYIKVLEQIRSEAQAGI